MHTLHNLGHLHESGDLVNPLVSSILQVCLRGSRCCGNDLGCIYTYFTHNRGCIYAYLKHNRGCIYAYLTHNRGCIYAHLKHNLGHLHESGDPVNPRVSSKLQVCLRGSRCCGNDLGCIYAYLKNNLGHLHESGDPVNPLVSSKLPL